MYFSILRYEKKNKNGIHTKKILYTPYLYDNYENNLIYLIKYNYFIFQEICILISGLLNFCFGTFRKTNRSKVAGYYLDQ